MLQAQLEAAAGKFLQPENGPKPDFTVPLGEPALIASDSVSWQVFKNPLSLFIGGVAAVILELAEPRVRTGVWEHTSFRDKPLQRLRHTGLAAMMTVYGPRSQAEAMIAAVGRKHALITGTTPDGQPYQATDPELLNWVQATASFGFLEAYHAYVRPLSDKDRDRFYAESRHTARLYGAVGAPTSQAELNALFEAMRSKLEPSEIVFEFLNIMRRVPALPWFARPMQGLLIKAAIEITPYWVRKRLGLDRRWKLRSWQRRLIKRAGAIADRLVLASSPAVQACRRLGLPSDYLYRS